MITRRLSKLCHTVVAKMPHQNLEGEASSIGSLGPLTVQNYITRSSLTIPSSVSWPCFPFFGCTVNASKAVTQLYYGELDK